VHALVVGDVDRVAGTGLMTFGSPVGMFADAFWPTFSGMLVGLL